MLLSWWCPLKMKNKKLPNTRFKRTVHWWHTLSLNEHCHIVHRVEMAASWRTFHHAGKISPAWWGWVRSCFSLQSWVKLYHPCPIISRLICDKFPIMIVRDFIIVLQNRPEFQYFCRDSISFFLFLQFVTLWPCIMWSAWICGVATGKVPSDFQILFAKSPYLSAPYLIM